MTTWSQWLNRTTIVTMAGVSVSVYVDGPRHVIALAVAVTFLVAIAHAVTAETWEARSLARMCGSAVRVSICATSVVTCAGLVARWHPGLALATVSALVISMPPVLAAVARRIGRRRQSLDPLTDSGREEPGTLPALSDRELRLAWSATSNALETQTDACRCVAVVVTRQHLLDEIWSRDRVALEAWAAAGADDGEERYFDA